MFEASVPNPLALAFPLLICITIVFPSPETPPLSLCPPDAYEGAAINEPVTNIDAAKMAKIPKVVFELIIMYYSVDFPCI
jgi:hypothetical protein